MSEFPREEPSLYGSENECTVPRDGCRGLRPYAALGLLSIVVVASAGRA